MRLTVTEADGRRHVDITPEQAEATGVAPDMVLSAVKAHLHALVDAQAEALRSRVVTPGAGQALEYQEAQAQAAAALAGGASSATAERYPMLAVTVGIDIDPQTGEPAADILGVARGVQAARGAWLAIGVAIRGARLKGKAAIGAATTLDEAIAAHAAIAWPAPPD
ncbi:hypothetical protein ACQVP2_35145 [Methylobacterium aquaticum]|uniref:hypothetical protein n=1 Tax=Methylobacterium aquaticum TaxID=270351 RepID=UPI003D1723F4